MSGIGEFFQEQDAVGARVVPGWLSRGRTSVPAGTFGYLVPQGEPIGTVIDSSEELDPSESEAAWILRAGTWQLDMESAGLTSADGLPFDLQIVVAVEILPSGTAARQFLAGRSWPDRIRRGDVAERVSGGLRESFGGRLEKESLDYLVSLEPARAREVLSECGEEVFFERGMRIHGVTSIDVRGVELQELRDREVEIKLEEERVRQRLRFIDLWKRQEVGETLAKRDVEAMARYLKQEGVLRELDHQRLVAEHKREEDRRAREAEQQLRHLLDLRELEHTMEIDARKLDEEIERTQRINEVIQEGGIEAHLFHLRDEKLKARLYRLLLERDMTPEQIRARSAGATAEDLSELSAHLRELIGTVGALVEQCRRDGSTQAFAFQRAGPESLAPRGPVLNRLLLVSGQKIHSVRLDPQGNAASPVDLLSLQGRGLGPLRSIRVAREAGAALFLVGAQNGAYVVDVSREERESRTFGGTPRDVELYRYEAHEEAVRGGANSVALHQGSLYATHSEKGLVRWRRYRGDSPEVLDRPQGTPPTLRGVHVDSDGLAWYAKGSEILVFDPGFPHRILRRLGGVREEISSFVVVPGSVVAGTCRGRLVRWLVGGSGEPETVNPKNITSLGDHTVYMVRALPVEGDYWCLAGAGSDRVWVSRGPSKVQDYRAPRPVSWVGACGRHLYAIDRRFHVLYIWDWEKPGRPVGEFRFVEKVRDLWADLEPATAGREGEHGTLA
jgi:hypothetical protein